MFEHRLVNDRLIDYFRVDFAANRLENLSEFRSAFKHANTTATTLQTKKRKKLGATQQKIETRQRSISFALAMYVTKLVSLCRTGSSSGRDRSLLTPTLRPRKSDAHDCFPTRLFDVVRMAQFVRAHGPAVEASTGTRPKKEGNNTNANNKYIYIYIYHT